MILTAILTPAEEGGYVAINPETGTLRGVLKQADVDRDDFLTVLRG